MIEPEPRMQAMLKEGVHASAAEGYAALLRDANQGLNDVQVPGDGRREWIIPGRIEVLGKHVDYAGGRSLLCAVERGFVVVARPHADRSIVVRDATRREAIFMPLDVRSPTPSGPPWNVYLSAVARRFTRNFGADVLGCDIAIASNLPAAAGVSSSSALVVGLALAVAGISGLDALHTWRAVLPDRLALAGYLGALENGLTFGPLTGQAGVGTMGGAQDHTAILCSAANQLGQFAWSPVRQERWVPFPDDLIFVIAVSGVVASKIGAVRERYNRAARTVRHLLQSWNVATTRADATLADALNSAPDAPAQLANIARNSATEEFTADHLLGRLEQFQQETNENVPLGAEAAAAGDWKTFAHYVAASQAGAERALENQVPETTALVREALNVGAIAASAFGAGFGGSVWALVPVAEADEFSARWRAAYEHVAPVTAAKAQFFTTRPGPPAFEITV
ncbi:MAG: galactokinase [Phycisphaerae bacterium]|nr:galactokinase [Gemmatimonadaceae bacterium]